VKQEKNTRSIRENRVAGLHKRKRIGERPDEKKKMLNKNKRDKVKQKKRLPASKLERARTVKFFIRGHESCITPMEALKQSTPSKQRFLKRVLGTGSEEFGEGTKEKPREDGGTRFSL